MKLKFENNEEKKTGIIVCMCVYSTYIYTTNDTEMSNDVFFIHHIY